MPQRKSGLKELRKNRKNRLRNLDLKTRLKKSVKTFLACVNRQDKEEAAQQLKEVYKKLDKATKRNLLHKNTASRRKSLYSQKLAALAKS